MKKINKAGVVKYAVSIAICIALVWLYLGLRDFSGADTMEKYRMLSDAFLIPGVLLFMSGCLVSVANQGALDGISYASSRALRRLIPGVDRVDEKYFDYVQRKREKRIRRYGFLFVVGGVSLAISVLFMILFYRLYS